MTQTHTTCYNRLLFRSLLEGLNMLQRKKRRKKEKPSDNPEGSHKCPKKHEIWTAYNLQLDSYIHRLSLQLDF